MRTLDKTRFLLCVVTALILAGCGPQMLPTVGRTHGDLPMTIIMEQQEDCWSFLKPVYFEAPFATGMSFDSNSCLTSEQKIGRKTVAEIAAMKVSMTYDGEYYIIKNGY